MEERMAKAELAKKRRSNDARERYSLKPHERRTMIEMAKRAPVVDHTVVRTLAFHFDCAQKRVVETLQTANIEIEGTGVAQPTTPPQAAEKVPKKSKLKLSLATSNPDPKPAEPSKTENLELERTRLRMRENQLASREHELAEREGQVAQLQLELEEALRHIDDTGTLPPSHAAAEPEPSSPPPERDPDAQPVRLVGFGFVRQVMQGLVMERDATRRDFEEASEKNSRLQREIERLERENEALAQALDEAREGEVEAVPFTMAQNPHLWRLGRTHRTATSTPTIRGMEII